MTTRTVETERTIRDQGPVDLCEVCGKSGDTENPLHEVRDAPGHEPLHFHAPCVPTLDGDGVVPVDSRTPDELDVVRSTKKDPAVRVISAESSQMLGGLFFWGIVATAIAEFMLTGLLAAVVPLVILCVGFLVWLMVDQEGSQQAQQSLCELFRDNS